MPQQMKEYSDNMGKQHDDDGIINYDADENGLEDDEDFDIFNENEDVTREADEAYLDMLNDITGSGNNVVQFLMGEEWDQDLDKDYDNYTRTLMALISSSP